MDFVASALGFSIDSNYPIKRLNDSVAERMARFYFRKDSWISYCRNYIFQRVFKGDIKIKWGKGVLKDKSLTPKLETQTMTLEELIQMLMTALDWKKLYGMCPYRIVELPNGLKRAFIPQIGTGCFYQVFNPLLCKPHVFYILKSKFVSPSMEFTDQKKFLQAVEESEMYVYVWPGFDPSYVENDYNSEVAKIYEEYLLKNKFLDNTIYADDQATHPLILTKSKMLDKSIESYTERETYLEAGIVDIPGPEERRTYLKDTYRSKQIKNISSRENMQKIGIRDSVRQKMEENSKNIINERQPRYLANSIMALPVNEDIANIPIPKPQIKIFEMLDLYRNEVCLIMGLNRTLVEGQFKKETISSNELLKQNLRTVINNHRLDAQTFFQDVYFNMYGQDDNIFIAEQIFALQNGNFGDDADDTENNIKAKEAKIIILESLYGKKTNISLEFKQQPLLEMESIQVVDDALKHNYMFFIEALRLTRGIMGLEPLTFIQEKELEREYKKTKEMERFAMERKTMKQSEKRKTDDEEKPQKKYKEEKEKLQKNSKEEKGKKDITDKKKE